MGDFIDDTFQDVHDDALEAENDNMDGDLDGLDFAEDGLIDDEDDDGVLHDSFDDAESF